MNDDTHYDILGVRENATHAEIKTAYRNLLRRLHPDTVSTLSSQLREESEEVTKRIIEAYSILSDSKRRSQYDDRLSLLRRPNDLSGAKTISREKNSVRPPGYRCDVCGSVSGAAGVCAKCSLSRSQAHVSGPVYRSELIKAAILTCSAALISALMIVMLNSKPAGTRARPPVQASSAEMAKLLVKRVLPEYPAKARSNRMQGLVTLRLAISSAGDVMDVSVISGDPSLAKAAIKAVKGFKYKPWVVDGQPVEVETTIQMNFVLSGS